MCAKYSHKLFEHKFATVVQCKDLISNCKPAEKVYLTPLIERYKLLAYFMSTKNDDVTY